MRFAKRLGNLAIAAGVACLIMQTGPAPASPRESQSPQQPPLKYEVSVTLKLIQVYVTDKSGKPVRDLTKDEFKLTDNGKPVTLSAFEKHDLAAAPTVRGRGAGPGADARYRSERSPGPWPQIHHFLRFRLQHGPRRQG